MVLVERLIEDYLKKRFDRGARVVILIIELNDGRRL